MCAEQHLCPYCLLLVRDSADHIFPAFLGGKRTIRACKACNDRFGHAFESSVSSDLAPTAVMLRRAGLRSPRRVVWKRALEIDGREYDLDSNLSLTPSKPLITFDGKGMIERAIFSNEQAAKSFIRGQEARGKKLKTSRTLKNIDLRRLNLKIHVGMEMRRLAVKMAMAVSDLMGFRDNIVDAETRNFLLGNIETTQRVRIDFGIHSTLEALRPPLSHSVFIKGNGQTHKCYAIVQFYGLVQLYVLLNDGGFTGSDFAILAILDVAKKYVEHFDKTELLMLPEAPQKIGHWKSLELKAKWMKKFNSEAQIVLQDDAQLVFLQTI
jgi:HNH endonuclease